MSDNFTKLLENSTIEEIISILKDKLDESDEADFWKEKIIPFTEAILSVLIPLKEQNILFNPEGKIIKQIDSDLFFRWADLVCLKSLAFIIEQSNKEEKLIRTDYKEVEYKSIDLEKLGVYLSSNGVNIIDEDSLDFPMATYNLHIGMTSVIKKLLK